ncbi:hypothetical protein DIPPA_29436 [Diplonema papillatum]|nr:hypothetical protein DIPPA_29436 [Diplonema papillatum]
MKGSVAFARKVAVLLGTLLCVATYYISLSSLAKRDALAGDRMRASGIGGLWRRGQDERPTNSVSRWDQFDWLPPRDPSTLLKEYVQHEPSPQWKANERRLSCADNETDALVAEGVDIVVRHVSKDYVNPAPQLEAALAPFEAAIARTPDCWTARVNLAILLPAVGTERVKDCKRMLDLLETVPNAHPLHGKALLYVGIAKELEGGREREAHEQYWKAIRASPRLLMLYFGKTEADYKEHKKPVSLFRDARMKNEEGLRLQVKTLTHLLVYYEYAKHFSHYNYVSRAEARAFNDVWYTVVKGLLPPYVLKLLQDCYRTLIKKGILKFDDKQAHRYYHHNAPPARFMAAVFTAFISSLFDQPMKTTYTYMGGYPGGSELRPHVDRAQCEITMSISIDVNPGEESCPLGLRLQPKKLLREKSVGQNKKPDNPDETNVGYVHPHPGDALVFRGRGLIHWRDPIPAGMNCTNIFLHFVKEDFVGKID